MFVLVDDLVLLEYIYVMGFDFVGCYIMYILVSCDYIFLVCYVMYIFGVYNVFK